MATNTQQPVEEPAQKTPGQQQHEEVRALYLIVERAAAKAPAIGRDAPYKMVRDPANRAAAHLREALAELNDAMCMAMAYEADEAGFGDPEAPTGARER